MLLLFSGDLADAFIWSGSPLVINDAASARIYFYVALDDRIEGLHAILDRAFTSASTSVRRHDTII